MRDFQLPLGVAQRGEQVQFDPGLRAQAVLEVLGLVLHGRQRRHQHLCVFFIFLIFMKLLADTEKEKVEELDADTSLDGH